MMHQVPQARGAGQWLPQAPRNFRVGAPAAAGQVPATHMLSALSAARWIAARTRAALCCLMFELTVPLRQVG